MSAACAMLVAGTLDYPGYSAPRDALAMLYLGGAVAVSEVADGSLYCLYAVVA